MKAQSSLEFLVFASISILFLVSAVTFFGVRSEEVAEMKKVSEMRGICNSVSTKISAVFSAGPGAKIALDLPEAVAGNDITIWAYGGNSTVVVRDDETSVGCSLNTQSVSNGTAGSFRIASNATIGNVKGVVFIG